MATNKIHFLAFMLLPYVFPGQCDGEWFSEIGAAQVIMNDSIRAYVGPREYTHFSQNPRTGKVSWMRFPESDMKTWTKEILEGMEKFSAGKIGTAVVDEATVPEEFWLHNAQTPQNEHLYLHLVQDKTYDRFIRTVIDTSRRYEDIYAFGGETMTGAQLRGQGMERWTRGLLNELDDQFFVRLVKRYHEATDSMVDFTWISMAMEDAIKQCYSAELAEATLKFVTLSYKANGIIETLGRSKFDEEVWPVPNALVDQWIDWMFEDILDALKRMHVIL